MEVKVSSYNDFLNVVDSLLSGTVFDITYDWCTAQGLKLTPNTAKSWGRKFVTDYVNHNCSLTGNGTDKHNTYRKK